MKTPAPSRAFWARVALHALWLHGAWEAVQCALFYDMSGVSPLPGFAFMAGATLADGVLTLLLVLLALRLSATSAESPSFGAFPWLIGLGTLAAIAIELLAQAGSWWRYSDAMPTLPMLGVPIGVLPLLQMATLPPICLFLASKRRGFR